MTFSSCVLADGYSRVHPRGGEPGGRGSSGFLLDLLGPQVIVKLRQSLWATRLDLIAEDTSDLALGKAAAYVNMAMEICRRSHQDTRNSLHGKVASGGTCA